MYTYCEILTFCENKKVQFNQLNHSLHAYYILVVNLNVYHFKTSILETTICDH